MMVQQPGSCIINTWLLCQQLALSSELVDVIGYMTPLADGGILTGRNHGSQWKIIQIPSMKASIAQGFFWVHKNLGINI